MDKTQEQQGRGTGEQVEGEKKEQGEEQQQVSEPGNELPTRFEVELEFVQSLANIQYITYLVTQQNNLFKDPKFKNYLKYLEYWCDPPYSQCIVYPNALYVLKLINSFLESHATPSSEGDGLLEGVDELPRFLQLHGGELMNDMVNRWGELK